MSDLPVPVLPTKIRRGWPDHERGGAVSYLSLGSALLKTFDTDAHLAVYSVPALARRLNKPALARRDVLPDGIPVIAAIFDVDCESSHRASGATSPAPASDEWWLTQLPKLTALLEVHPGGYIYRTRGGYRIVYLLDGYVLRVPTDDETWSSNYVAWVAYLRRVFGIIADPACNDWTRLYRLPRVTRDGIAEEHETMGDARAIGAWTCEPTLADVDLAKTLRRQRKPARGRKAREERPAAHVGDGVLFQAFKARAWLGAELRPGKWSARCPWGDTHSDGRGDGTDSSSVLFAPPPGEEIGFFHCSHAHCTARVVADVLSLFTTEEIDAARAAAGLAPRTPYEPRAVGATTPDERPTIVVDPSEHRVNSEAAAALAKLDGVYQRGGRLVDVVQVEGRHIIRELPIAHLRDLLAGAARWIKLGEDAETGAIIEIATHVPEWSVRAIHVRGDWSVPTLHGITEGPVLRPDGSVLQEPGYDPATRLLFVPNDEFLPVPESPTREECTAALSVLAEPWSEFSYATEPHRYASIAVVLTAFARPYIRGAVPAHAITATGPGVGKTLDSNVSSVTIAGRPCSPVTYPDKEEELEKILASYGMRGDRIVCFDNVTSRFGGGPIDKVITAVDSVDLRMLGRTEIVTVPWNAVVVWTANSPDIADDTQRRLTWARHESTCEDPETRTNFKRKDLLAWVSEHRPQLVQAALTILRGYIVAGKPAVEGVTTWGSFEAWSAIVPTSIVWAGGQDPMRTRLVFGGARLGERAVLDALLEGWSLLDTTGDGLTCGSVVRALTSATRVGAEPPPDPHDWYAPLRETLAAIATIGGRLDARKLGEWIARREGRAIGSRRFIRGADLHKVARWKVETASADVGVNGGHGGHSQYPMGTQKEVTGSPSPVPGSGWGSPPRPPRPPRRAPADYDCAEREAIAAEGAE